MTSPRKHKTGEDDTFVLGKWIDSMAALVDAQPELAGIERHRVVEYDRGNISRIGRGFNAASASKHNLTDTERVKAGRHVLTLAGAPAEEGGLDAKHLEILNSADIPLAIRAFKAPDVLFDKMQKLYDITNKHGIGLAIHQPAPDTVAIHLTPPPQPRLTPKPKPPAKFFKRGF